MKLHQPKEHVYSADVALQMLKEGNERFVEDHLSDKSSYSVDRKSLENEQNPFAVVICCSDSRVAPEVFFDQKLGDIFVIRNAGNIVDDVVFGSVEYAVESLHCPLVVVCGHSHCGAITAACHGGHDFPHIGSLLERIAPSVHEGLDVEEVVRLNIENMVNQLKEDLAHMEPHTKVVGAYYDIVSGVVSWM